MKNRIKSLRIEKGLSQAELSEQIGCTQQSLSKIENGIQIPGVDLAFKIADFFNVTVEFLYSANLQSCGCRLAIFVNEQNNKI